MRQRVGIAFLITAISILFVTGRAFAPDPPHSSAQKVYCNSCHSVHKASGTSLTNKDSNENLCLSCHVVAKNSNKPFSTADQADLTAIPTTGISHRWETAMETDCVAYPDKCGTNSKYGLKALSELTSTALKSRLTTYGNVVTCSVCHNQHGQADTPWDPYGGPYTGMKGGDSGTASDNGTTTTIKDTTKSWTAGGWINNYVKMTSGTNIGQIRRISGNINNELTVSAPFPAAIAKDDKYEIIGRHFQRISDDLNQMCEDCHYYRTAGTTGTNVRTYDEGYKKSHPVVKIFTNDTGRDVDYPAQFNDAPLEPDYVGWVAQTGARYHIDGGSDNNATNNIVVDSSKKVRCLSCHGIHYTDSSSGTIDGPSAVTGDGDGYLLKRSPEETCHSCHRTNVNTPSPGETGYVEANWNNAIKMHSAETLGTCTNPTYKTQTACVAKGGTWDPGKWGGSGDPGWGTSAVGSKYGEILCTTCHTAHDTKNIYLIKEIIKTPDGSFFQGRVATTVAVGFRTTATGSSIDPGLMGDDTHDAPTSARICEVCHTYDATQTSGVNKHAYDMSSGAVVHHDAGGCTSCHSHKGAFTGGGCNGCHGYPPVADTAAPPNGLAWTNTTGSETAGKHSLHATAAGRNYPCATCHNNSAGSGTTHNNNLITLEFYMFGGTYQGGAYDGQTAVTDGYDVAVPNTTPQTTVTKLNSKKCSNLYCHGRPYIGTWPTGNWEDLGGGSDMTPAWVGTAACGTCHGANTASTTNSPTRGSHPTHTGAADGRQLPCSDCHYGYTPSGTGMATHVNNQSNFAFNTTKNYIGSAAYNDAGGMFTYGTCSNLYCHSIVQTSTGGGLTLGTSDYKTVQWGSGAMTCASCHDNPPASGSHSKHAVTYAYTCAQCHNGKVPPVSTHSDGSINTSIHTNWSGAYEGSTIPGSGFSSCSNTYCHSKGTSVSTGLIPANASPNWGGSTTCGSCHGEGVASGRPTYANNDPKTNSHSKHLAYGCNKCHVNTTSDGTSITGKANHVNKTYNVDAGPGASFGYTYYATGGTCSSISCHYNGDSTWGATLSCGSCHSTPPATGAHMAHTDGTGAAYDSDSNASVAGTYRFNCGNCHPLDSANHANGTKDVELYNASATGFKQYNPFGAGVKSGSGDTTVCENVYCHSNGMAAPAYIDTPSWGGTFAGNRCAGCHGDPPNTGGRTGSAGHYAANWMGAGKEGGHLVGIHFDNVYTGTTGLIAKGGGAGSGAAHGDPGTSTTISCNLCHTATANWTANGQFSTKSGTGTAFSCGVASCHDGASAFQNTAGTITDKSKHVNHDRDVQFASFTLKSKSQNRTAPAGWTRNSYKVDGTSYDNITFSMTYNSSEKSCMTSCHLGHAIKWDDTNITTCYSCHKDL